MNTFAFKVFYNGSKYLGFQRQPNGMTVENYLEMAFIKGGYISCFNDNNYKSTSRTDAGVSAIGNIFTLEVERLPNLIELNHYLPKDGSIIIWAFTAVSETFHPRKKLTKEYTYFLIDENENFSIPRLLEFEGRHDFSTFIKADGAGKNDPWTNIINIKVEKNDTVKIINIIGDHFGREQIRRMIGFILDKRYVDYDVKEMLTTVRELDITPADSQFLFLKQINYESKLNWSISPNLHTKLRYNLKKLNKKIISHNMQKMMAETLKRSI